MTPPRGVEDAAPYSGNPEALLLSLTSAAARGLAALRHAHSHNHYIKPPLPHTLTAGGICMPRMLPVVLVWYIFTELGSIAENAAAMGAPVPGWLVRILAQGKEGAKK